MEYRRLGRSGLQVSVVGLGGNNFGMNLNVAGMPIRADERQSIRVIDAALDAGINFIDSANEYGESEVFVGKAVKGKRDRAVLTSKFANKAGDGPNDTGGSRKHIMHEVEKTLRRMQTDYIDLYQMHRADPITPIEETLRALDDVVRQGKVRYIGCSNYQSWQLSDAVWTSRFHNLSSFVSVQPEYNLLRRGVEQDLLPCCETLGVGLIPYFPLASGLLTGKYRAGEAPDQGTRLGDMPAETTSRMLSGRRMKIVSELNRFAQDRGHTLGELAIGWLAANPLVGTIIAGATKPEQVVANAKGADWKLTQAELDEIDTIAPAR